VKPDLDRLLLTLRDSPTDHPRLPEVERLVWQRLEAGEPQSLWRRCVLPLQVAAVLGAFVWGILIGVNGPAIPPYAKTAGLFVEQAEFLALPADDSAN
jgi:hypothetical protein